MKRIAALVLFFILVGSINGVDAGTDYFGRLTDRMLSEELSRNRDIDYQVLEARIERDFIRGSRHIIDARWVEMKEASLSVLFSYRNEEALLSSTKKVYSTGVPSIDLDKMIQELIQDYYEQIHLEEKTLSGVVMNDSSRILNVSIFDERREIFYFHALSPGNDFEIDLPVGFYEIITTTDSGRDYGKKNFNLRQQDFKLYFEGDLYDWMLLIDREMRIYPN